MHLSPEQKTAVNAKNGNFRQHLGEPAAVALGRFASGLGPTPITCVVRSQVTNSNDVFDMYGRLIGDVYVQVGHTEINLNHWLLQHGHAFPAFYDSMTKQEISDIQALVEQAQTDNAGVWSHYTAKANEFDARRRAPKAHVTYSAAKDQQAVSFPKLFRRASAWGALKAAGLQTTRYIEYLKAHPDAATRRRRSSRRGRARRSGSCRSSLTSATGSRRRRVGSCLTRRGVFWLMGRGGRWRIGKWLAVHAFMEELDVASIRRRAAWLTTLTGRSQNGIGFSVGSGITCCASRLSLSWVIVPPRLRSCGPRWKRSSAPALTRGPTVARS